MERIGGRGFETELVAEVVGFLVCVGDHGPHSNRLCDGGAAQQRILKQGSADPSVLVIAIDSEPCEDEDGHGSLGRLPLQQSLRCTIWLNLANRQRVIADDMIPFAGYEGARRAGSLGVSGMAMEPVVQRIFLAAKVAEVVLPSQRLGLRIRHDLLEDAWLREELAQPAGDTRWPVE